MVYLAMDPNKTLRDGYDLPVYGLEEDELLNIHAPALTCIFASMVCAFIVLVTSFMHSSIRSFFTWTKPERFVVYLALCDALFNICHSFDHLHIVITENHVYPQQLCEFYAFMLAEFMTAQHLLVNIICINAFLLVVCRKDIDFGTCDWKLVGWVFGFPLIASVVATCAGVMGPNGVFCYFDGVKGQLANLFFTTIPVVMVIVIDAILYIATWYKIRQEEPRFVKTKDHVTVHRIRASHRAARNMSVFVVAFIVQWWPLAFLGLWYLADENIPRVLFQLLTTFVNTGGVLNLIVYIIIRKRKGRFLKRGSFVSGTSKHATDASPKTTNSDRIHS